MYCIPADHLEGGWVGFPAPEAQYSSEDLPRKSNTWYESSPVEHLILHLQRFRFAQDFLENNFEKF
jgi:hypothetical protein